MELSRIKSILCIMEPTYTRVARLYYNNMSYTLSYDSYYILYVAITLYGFSFNALSNNRAQILVCGTVIFAETFSLQNMKFHEIVYCM